MALHDNQRQAAGRLTQRSKPLVVRSFYELLGIHCLCCQSVMRGTCLRTTPNEQEAVWHGQIPQLNIRLEIK